MPPKKALPESEMTETQALQARLKFKIAYKQSVGLEAKSQQQVVSVQRRPPPLLPLLRVCSRARSGLANGRRG